MTIARKQSKLYLDYTSDQREVLFARNVRLYFSVTY